MYSEACQTFKIQLFANITNDFQLLTIFAKSPILNLLQSSENGSGGIFPIVLTEAYAKAPIMLKTNSDEAYFF